MLSFEHMGTKAMLGGSQLSHGVDKLLVKGTHRHRPVGRHRSYHNPPGDASLDQPRHPSREGSHDFLARHTE